MPNIIPKRNTLLVCIIVAAIIAALPFLWYHSFAALWHERPLFKICLLVFWSAFLVTILYWLSSLSDPAYEEKSGRIGWVILAFVICFAWTAGWCSQYKTDGEIPGIQYHGK